MNFKIISNFNQGSIFLDIFHAVKVKQNHSNLSIKALRGIILPETCNISLNDSIGSPFPFNIPFHPGEGPEIDYPDGPYEPEYPEEDPGDDPDD